MQGQLTADAVIDHGGVEAQRQEELVFAEEVAVRAGSSACSERVQKAEALGSSACRITAPKAQRTAAGAGPARYRAAQGPDSTFLTWLVAAIEAVAVAVIDLVARKALLAIQARELALGVWLIAGGQRRVQSSDRGAACGQGQQRDQRQQRSRVAGHFRWRN